ncbi:hypothetical protein [Micromonospora sp. NPDC049374]|uniref:hypothetical protein n=1 Tax=Micromonospora sp. NPDC049374 TaxID=3154352 RepID=UPI003447AB2F
MTSELPNPVDFDAASHTVTEDDIRQQFVVGPDPDGFLDFYRHPRRPPPRRIGRDRRVYSPADRAEGRR